MADTTIDLLKNSSYVGKMDELIAAVKLGSGATSDVEWDNVKNKPTTIGGYGITDAKIENGTITLGNQTITPLTSAPVTSVNSKTGAVTLSAADVSAIPSTLTGTAGQVLTKTADGQEWKDVAIPSGTNDHSKLSNRDAADQHPIGAITGLEAALANIPPTDAFIVTLTKDEGGTYSVDKTFAEIQTAIQSNRTVYLYSQDASMFLSLVFRVPERYVIFGYVSISSTDVYSIFVVVHNDDRVEVQQKILSKLPNPNALTFTGAVTGSYDGSAPLSVEIPSGGGSGGSAALHLLAEGTLTEDAASIDVDGFSADRIAFAVAPYGSTANSGKVNGLFTFGFSDDSSINININMVFVDNTAVKAWNKHIFYATVNGNVLDILATRDTSTWNTDIDIKILSNFAGSIIKRVILPKTVKITALSIGLASTGVIGANTQFKVVGA